MTNNPWSVNEGRPSARSADTREIEKELLNVVTKHLEQGFNSVSSVLSALSITNALVVTSVAAVMHSKEVRTLFLEEAKRIAAEAIDHEAKELGL